jgi:hypothetical protein
MAGYVDSSDPVVREALIQHAARIGADALRPILDSAVERGLTRQEVVEIARGAIGDGRSGTLDRISAALDEEIERRES